MKWLSLKQTSNMALERDISICINNLINGKFSDSLLDIIDLDDIKNINDTWGHEAGDLLLANFSEAIKASSHQKIKFTVLEVTNSH